MQKMMGGEGFYSEKKTGSDLLKPMSYLSSLDLVETPQEYKIYSDLPGVDPANLDVWLADYSLCIKAKRDEPYTETSETKVHTKHIAYGEIERHIRVPSNAALDQAKTEFKNGLLCVCFPKLTTHVEPEHRKLSVNVA